MTHSEGSPARRVALLLDDDGNDYQRLLVREAEAASRKSGIQLIDPEFARGSAWTQVESVNHLLRGARPDGVMLMLAGGQRTRAPFERLVKAGVPVAFLNRIPGWIEDLRRDYPAALVAAVTPRQDGIGEIQARQALRLVAPGSFVLLVTGDASSSTAVERRDGLRRAAGAQLALHEIDGRWSADGAEKALGEWFRIGADRERPIQLIVCQNDAMAVGVRAALARQAASSARPELARTPVTGCDGTDEGRSMVGRGELAATVVMPATTPAALEALARFWTTGSPVGTVQLEAVSHPPVESLGRP